MKPDDMDAVFAALAHRHRRRILDIVREHGGCNVNDVAAYFETSRIAVMKHLKVLEEAGLIVSKKEGRTRRLHFNAVPIQMIYDRWTSEYSAYWARGLTRLKYEIESAPRKHPRKQTRKQTPKQGRKTTSQKTTKRKKRARGAHKRKPDDG